MKTLSSTSGNKKVNIVLNVNGGFFAKHVQVINTGLGIEESLIQMKSFNTEKSAEKWAIKVL
jgi:hypothetical protein